MELYFLLLCFVWIDLGACQDTRWNCSSQDRDGFLYFPDVPADKQHIADASTVTLTKAFYIFETTPDCSGNIVGADFCYSLENISDTSVKRVLQFGIFEKSGDIFTQSRNFTEQTFIAIPLDHTNCVPISTNTSNCCQRMTTKSGLLRLVDGESLIIGVFIQNNAAQDYPLLKFGATMTQYHTVTRIVDLGRLDTQKNEFANTFDASNTNTNTVILPMLRFVVEPDNKIAVEDCMDTTTIIVSIGSLLITETLALAACLVALIITIILYKKQLKRKPEQPPRMSPTPTPGHGPSPPTPRKPPTPTPGHGLPPPTPRKPPTPTPGHGPPPPGYQSPIIPSYPKPRYSNVTENRSTSSSNEHDEYDYIEQ